MRERNIPLTSLTPHLPPTTKGQGKREVLRGERTLKGEYFLKDSYGLEGVVGERRDV